MNSNTPKVPFSLERIIKGMPEHAYVFSDEGKLLTWNKNIETLTEYSSDELLNTFVSDFICKDDKDRVAGKFLELIAEGKDKERIIEYCLQTKYGKSIPCLAMRSVVVVNNTKYMVGILIDISKLKNNKDKLDTYITEITHVKNQLQDHFRKIEKLQQSEIELKARLHFNTEAFNSKVINNMPGIFYAYEKVGDKFFLKKWNKNYVIDLGYLEEELLNKEAHEFFTKKEYEKVKIGVTKVFTNGKAQVEYYTLHKSGKQIPYFYEAYPFEDKGRQYFIGIGLDISERYAFEKKQKWQEREKRKAKKTLDANKRELVATALDVSRTSKTIEYALEKIDYILLNHNEESEICNSLVNVKNDLNLQIKGQENWEIFKLRFTDVHKNFFNDLKTKHPKLTKSELKFCAYLHISLTSSQISSVLSISHEGIKKTRYRIRKKLGLERKDSLEDYITNI